MRFLRPPPILIASVLALAPPLGVRADVAHLSASARSLLERAVAEASHDPKFRLADPGQDRQETDVVVIPWLPKRRLVFAASSPHGRFASELEGPPASVRPSPLQFDAAGCTVNPRSGSESSPASTQSTTTAVQ